MDEAIIRYYGDEGRRCENIKGSKVAPSFRNRIYARILLFYTTSVAKQVESIYIHASDGCKKSIAFPDATHSIFGKLGHQHFNVR